MRREVSAVHSKVKACTATGDSEKSMGMAYITITPGCLVSKQSWIGMPPRRMTSPQAAYTPWSKPKGYHNWGAAKRPRVMTKTTFAQTDGDWRLEIRDLGTLLISLFP